MLKYLISVVLIILLISVCSELKDVVIIFEF